MKIKLAFISCLVMLILNSCIHTPRKIERYIERCCDIEMTDTCYVDLRKALKTDYDTMYVFNSMVPLTGAQSIIGIKDYGKYQNPETILIGNDSETCRIILVKNNKVVYEDEYHYNQYNTKISYQDFCIVKGQGIFDGNSVEVCGYVSTKHMFRVTKINNILYVHE